MIPASSSKVGMMSMLSTSALVRPTHLPPGHPIISGIFVPCSKFVISLECTDRKPIDSQYISDLCRDTQREEE